MKFLKKELLQKSKEIADYLILHLKENKSFKSRSFYGESFALNLISRHGIENEEITDILIAQYNLKDKNDSEFHFEFNNYAFSDHNKRKESSKVKKLYLPLKFKGTPCTNWTLLRSNVRFQEGIDTDIALVELNEKIDNYQLSSGLILDDVGVKSFQYHCFSAAMLYEVFEKTNNQKVLSSFSSAVEFIRKFILPNGDTLYIGRGQEQSFGLGVLIYILSIYYGLTKNDEVLIEIKLVLDFISKFQYATGAFPLVFTGGEQEEPGNVDMANPQFGGWYPYNNFFDYLPFMGFFLHKAFETLNLQNENFNIEEIKKNSNFIDYRDSSFIRINKNKYTAIVSLPEGYWTNDLPFPLVLCEKEFITPMLGGEQFQKSLYTYEALSMPTTIIGNWSWRKFGRGFLVGDGLIWISLFGLMYRQYSFSENSIAIKNTSLCWFGSEQNFSFLNGYENVTDKQLLFKGKNVNFSKKINSISLGYSAAGRLKIIKTKMNVKIIMEL